jgi:RNA polymerase-binding transcription factor DksA
MKRANDTRSRNARQWLAMRGDELRNRLRLVREDRTRASEPLPRGFDAAVALENDEVLRAVEETTADELRRIEQALYRLDGKDTTSCEVCSNAIEPERLRFRPFTTTCRHCSADA